MVGSEMTDISVAEIISTYHGYPQVNHTPYRSTLGDFDINVFVNPEAASAYARIDPDLTGSGAVVPSGAVIVRQVLDATGAVSKLTIMVKRATGFYPACGDWWFGVTDTSGNAINDSNGTPQEGAIAECASCHIPRATDDYLFGVPAAVRR
jgi:hypothetical protein